MCVPWNDYFRLGSKARTLLEVELNLSNEFTQTCKDFTGSTHLIKMTCLKIFLLRYGTDKM